MTCLSADAHSPTCSFDKSDRVFVLMVARAEILLQSLDPAARIIEIGPSYNPIAPKRDGWNTKTVDVAPRAELVEKYRASNVNLDLIEEVDFIWRGGPLSSAVPAHCHGAFDALIASHVIEHTPNLVDFLNSAAMLLAPTGNMLLAIPDKRFCADYFRPLTSTGDILAAHKGQRTRHTNKTLFDYHSRSALARYQHPWDEKPEWHQCWGQSRVDEIMLWYPLEQAYSLFDGINEDNTSAYVDAHAWVFTPANFELVVLELARLKLIDWQVDKIGPALGCEFFVRLRRGGAEAAAALAAPDLLERRLALLRHALYETKQQISYFAFSEPPRDPALKQADVASPSPGAEYPMMRSILEEAAVDRDPENERARIALAADLDAAQQTQAELVAQLAAVNSYCAAVLRDLARTKNTCDVLEMEAAQWFEAVLAITPNHDPLARRSRSSFLQKLLRRFGLHPDRGTVGLANHARDSGNWALAVRYYRDALDLDPDDPEIWMQCGDALEKAGKKSVAEVAYKRSGKLRSQAPR
jgi:SAM-dependent methyltransferase